MMMLSAIRKRFTYANVAATLALLFAMTGGAYAANKFLITSTKQISPKVLKALKGANGKNGANGAAGSVGSPGPAGPAGPGGGQGPQGPAGATGAAGKEGPPGKNGANGKEGSPWTAGGKLPEGATETGAWDVRGTATAEGEDKTTPISFTIRLAAEPSMEVIPFKGTTTNCKGTVEEPTAAEGVLCVYEGESALHKGKLKYIGAPVNFLPAGVGATGTVGLELVFETEKPTTAGEEVSAEGTWAVTG